MKKVFHSSIVSVFLFLPTYGYGQMGMMEGMMNMSMIRHHFVMQNGVDPNYVSKVNPLERNAANIAAGKKLYEKSCALCHGMKGLGDGEGGKGLKPPPANIAMFIKMHNVPDGYLFWTIAEGGIPLQTAMPPFKDVMREDEIWKTIIFLRELQATQPSYEPDGLDAAFLLSNSDKTRVIVGAQPLAEMQRVV